MIDIAVGLGKSRKAPGFGERVPASRTQLQLIFGGGPQLGNIELPIESAGINSVFYVSQDTAHEFQTWRRRYANSRGW